MIQRLVRDESGMTMALAVIMIVLIGVMGAGLLTFVQSDLKSVIEVNRSQKALDIAEAGVQAAKSHLRVDSFRQHYDRDVPPLSPAGNDCNEGPRVGGDNWSRNPWSYSDITGACSGAPFERADNPATPWREDIGVSKLFGGGRFHVTIECFSQTGDPSPSPCANGAGAAPEATTAADTQKFFRITSTGYDTPSGDGAVRKIEAIYTTAHRTYAPIAYWTPKNIIFTGGGNQTVSKISFFAGNDIRGVTSSSGGTIAIRNTEAIYRNWCSLSSADVCSNFPYNTTPRRNAAGTDLIGTGFGAGNLVCGSMNANSCTTTNISNLVADGYNDYDSTTGILRSGPSERACNSSLPVAQQRCITFKANPLPPHPTPATQITFPFNPGSAITTPRNVVEPGLVEEMKAAATAQGNINTTGGTLTTWPSDGEITYFVEGHDFTYSATSGQGMIIVRDGNVTFAANSEFKGVIIVIGDGTTTGTYTSSGNGRLDGYVAASGDISIKGNVNPSLTLREITLLNNFLDVKLWSWRELYQ
jgi:hypothetical protein